MRLGIVTTLAVLSCISVAPAEEGTATRAVGRGGKLFEPTDVDELLARPYVEHVPMASTGECLWAAHPDGWAFGNNVHYYLLTPSGIGFDLKLSVDGTPIEPTEATSYPSHVGMTGTSGPVRVDGSKWITADDAMVTHLTFENTSDAAATVEALLILPTGELQNVNDRISWETEKHGLKIGLMGDASRFIKAPAEPAVPKEIFTVEGEEPVTQNGTKGTDLKSAASGGQVLGSNFGEARGHFAEWDIPVADALSDAVLTFRYAQHTTEGNARFKITAAGKTLAEGYAFKPTSGWGHTAAELAFATFDLGPVALGPLRVRIETSEDGHGVNIDTVSVGRRGVEPQVQAPPVSRLARSIVLEPHQKTTLKLCVAASTSADKRDGALARVLDAEDPLAVQREHYLGWIVDNVPDFRSDEALTRQYWHRATSIVKKNLFKVGEGRLSRWAIAEGRWDNSWYPNAISYGVGHQVRETRWLRDPVYARDMLSTWCSNVRDNGIFPSFIRPNEIGDGQYTDWITSTAWDAYCVAPDQAKLREWADGLKRNVDGWLQVYDPDNDGLLLVDSHWWTGMEWQPSFFYFNGFDKDKQDQHLERVDLTAYVYGDAKNLSRILEAIGDTKGAERYARVADTIAGAVEKVMWDADTNFFYSVEPAEHRKSMVKEVVGVYPFYFSMFKPGSPYAAAWSSILDPEEFWTTWPVASATKKCPAYSQDITFNGKDIGACMWNGPTWPHANSIVLSAMAATLREHPESPLKVEDFHTLLRSFTMAQFLDQDLKFPWTGEYYNGDNAKWRTTERDYDHSTYVDILVADYAGLRPRPDDTLELQPLLLADTPAFVLDGVRYHDHDVTIAWAPATDTNTPDALTGYRVYIDGRLAHHTQDIPKKLELTLN